MGKLFCLFLLAASSLLLFCCHKSKCMYVIASDAEPRLQGKEPAPVQDSFIAQEAAVVLAGTLVGPPDPLAEGCFIDESTAWVTVGLTDLRRTTDGGKSWQKMHPLGAGWQLIGEIFNVYFITSNRGWLVTSNGTWQTEDGGKIWRKIFDKGAMPYFADEQSGWILVSVSTHSLQSYSTIDGGKTWEPCGPLRKENDHLPNKVFFLNRGFAWAITSQILGRRPIYGIALTTDGGCKWQQLWIGNDDPDEWYSDIFFLNKQEGWLSGKANGSLYHTTNGGKTWEPLPMPAENAKPTSIYFTSSKEGWILTKRLGSDVDGIFYTSDGCTTWRQITPGEILNGFAVNAMTKEIPARWRVGRLVRMLYKNRLNS